MENTTPKPKFNFIWVYLIIFGLILFANIFIFSTTTKETNFIEFKNNMLSKGDVSKITVINTDLVEITIHKDSLGKDIYKNVLGNSFKDNTNGPHFTFTIGSIEYFQNQLDEAMMDFPADKKISPRFEKRENWLAKSAGWLLPIVVIVFIWIFFIRRMQQGDGGMGNPMMNIGKSKAKLSNQGTKIDIDFSMVAGLEEAKVEIMEVVDFLKNPQKYTTLGAKIPKGVLLTGPPGTGKTLIAKAMAGESGVPFFSISGSDFVEMFVGVGAARVRDMFKEARTKAPCIIFIDEIEAIGRSRNSSKTQTNDERENTLNQLLVEMDGFDSKETIIILAATNRPDLLDSALLRPGRFDRQISIDKPDLNGRLEIFKVHLKKLKLADNIDVQKLADQTPGFAGAEIANVCNEAALHAARKGKNIVEPEDFDSAIDRVIGGLEKKNKIISPAEKKIIAYHEAGHAICGWFLPNAHPLVKVSIIPRGAAALGFAQYLPKEQNLYTYDELIDTICMTLGGRVTEEIIFGNISTGAQNDLERTTQMVYSMIAMYGMNKKVGAFSFKDLQNEYAIKQPFSEKTSQLIDEEARILIDFCYQKSKEILEKHIDDLHTIANELQKKEVLFNNDFVRILGERNTNLSA